MLVRRFGTLSRGEEAALFGRDPAVLAAFLHEFVREGLRKREPCIVVGSTLSRLQEGLSLQDVGHPERDTHTRLVTKMPPDTVKDLAALALDHARACATDAVRIAVDMTAFTHAASENGTLDGVFRAIDETMAETPCTFLCIYDTGLMRTEDLNAALERHALVCMDGILLENPFTRRCGHGEEEHWEDARIGALARWARLLRSMDEIKEKEDKARDARFKDIFDNVSDCLYYHDLEGNFDFNDCNARVREYWVGDVGAKGRKNLKDLIPERFRGEFGDYIDRVVKKGHDEGLVMIMTNMGTRVFEYRNSLVRDGDVPVGVRGSARDITDRLKAERELRKSEEKYRAILDGIEEGYYEVDLRGNFTFINQALCRLFQYEPEEVIGSSYKKFVSPVSAKKIFEVFHRVYLSGNPDKGSDWEVIRKDGVPIPIEGSVSLIKNSQGNPIGFRGILRDITQRTQAESYRQAMIRAEAQMKAKSEFLAHMSHEIRTPINGIIGMTEIALESGLTPEQYEVITTIYREAEHLLSLINDILDLSKLESSRIELERIPFDLRVLLEDVARCFALRAQRKGLELILHLSPDTPTSLVGDPGRLRQILTNLVGNAVKFTDCGEILIKVEPVDVGEQTTWVRFVVKDTGMGIPEEKQGIIFESFTQADLSTTRTHGGTGLGLAITKRLVELMGGQIALASKLNEGSSFQLDLPFVRGEMPRIPFYPESPKGDMTVVVVDDNASSREAIAAYLSTWGCGVVGAACADEALRILEERKARGLRVDCIITDSLMPSVDGFEFARSIRQHDDFKDIPIIMLTTVGSIGDARRCIDAGIQGYLPKPIQKDDLIKTVSLVIAGKQSPEKCHGIPLITRHSLKELDRSGITILLAEDYPTNREVALRHLRAMGYRVDAVEDGIQAVAAFKLTPYDLVLMDVEMPHMDGFDAARAIREIEARMSKSDCSVRRHTPIVALTAHVAPGFRERCMEAGMDDYVSKPLKRETLYAVVDKWTFKGKEKGRNSCVGGQAGVPCAGPESEEEEDHPPMDLEQALAEFDQDREFLLSLIATFIKNVEGQIVTMRDALARGDARTLRSMAHSIKGGAGNLTAKILAECALRLENLAREGEMGCACEALESIEREFARFRKYVADYL